MSRKVNATYTADQVKVAFKVFEAPNNPGKIRAEALIKALCTYGVEKLTEEQGYIILCTANIKFLPLAVFPYCPYHKAQDLVSQLEVDSNGYINYVDYINMMMSS